MAALVKFHYPVAGFRVIDQGIRSGIEIIKMGLGFHKGPRNPRVPPIRMAAGWGELLF